MPNADSVFLNYYPKNEGRKDEQITASMYKLIKHKSHSTNYEL
jgi:hypothetical protein